MAKALAKICAPKIRVNSVSPGVLLTVCYFSSVTRCNHTELLLITRMWNFQEWGQKFPQAALDASRDKTVLKRFATVEDVAEQVRTLALSRSMTGHNVVIDSGFTL